MVTESDSRYRISRELQSIQWEGLEWHRHLISISATRLHPPRVASIITAVSRSDGRQTKAILLISHRRNVHNALKTATTNYLPTYQEKPYQSSDILSHHHIDYRDYVLYGVERMCIASSSAFHSMTQPFPRSTYTPLQPTANDVLTLPLLSPMSRKRRLPSSEAPLNKTERRTSAQHGKSAGQPSSGLSRLSSSFSRGLKLDWLDMELSQSRYVPIKVARHPALSQARLAVGTSDNVTAEMSKDTCFCFLHTARERLHQGISLL